METRMKFTQGMGRMLSDARARQVIGFVGALALISIAQPAFADGTAIEGGLNTIKAWMTTVASVCQADRSDGLGKSGHGADWHRYHFFGHDDRRLDEQLGWLTRIGSPRIRCSSP
jgi:hypothetical protein